MESQLLQWILDQRHNSPQEVDDFEENEISSSSRMEEKYLDECCAPEDDSTLGKGLSTRHRKQPKHLV